ncbi:MAG TPA: tRNA 2-thiouridine(34) synthase MnmA [Candidatus Onthoplasma faecigallinarum]|nr:tRNA 2-thiouridine(34) synthase MnmA [Candidatus Onthoplasma faecigallinarum]
MKTVVVGLSGGVDSSVAAYLLKKQGYNVVGLFMLNWEEQDDGGHCSAEQDFEDVKRVANKIGIPYYTVNYSKEYKDRVFSYFLDEYKKGYTPNPDVLCNKEIKFGPFLKHALELGADYIATGHYCKRVDRDGKVYLYKSHDKSKDQTYFLNQLSQAQLKYTLFPLADIDKTEVRRIAKELGLVTAEKKDSTGICFIGERNFRKFLKTYLPAQKGLIKDLSGNVVGEHDGVMYYTIGQRRGLNIGGKDGYDNDRWFVVKKDVSTNTLYVNCGECDEMYSRGCIVKEFNWITDEMKSDFSSFVKLRYRQPDQKVRVKIIDEHTIQLDFEEKQRAVTIGQFAVLYAEDGMCYGGGRIDSLL